MCVCARMRACVCVCVRARVRVCVRACMRGTSTDASVASNRLQRLSDRFPRTTFAPFRWKNL